MRRSSGLGILLLAILMPWSPSQAETLKVKLSEASFPLLQPERADWVRLELDGNQVKLMHTTQVLDWFFGVYNWHDHPPTRVVFVPEGCANKAGGLEQQLLALQQELKQGLLKEPEYESQKKELVEQFLSTSEPTCVVTGADTVTLLTQADMHRGMWTVDYVENNQNKSVTFKVPVDQPKDPSLSEGPGPSRDAKNQKR